MSFFQELERRTTAERTALFQAPQLVDGVAGRISRETYVAYLAQAYHHVRHTAPLLILARDRMDASHAAFRAGLDAYVAEETGHEQWILDDIANAGGDADGGRAGAPAAPTAAMVAFAYDCVSRGNPMGVFGMVYVLEGTSIALASQGASAVASALGLGPECFSYLSSHGAIDQEHMAFFAGLMNQVEDPEDQDSIVHVARRVFALFADMFRAIPHDRELAHAV
jgi:heme oxygenase